MTILNVLHVHAQLLMLTHRSIAYSNASSIHNIQYVQCFILRKYEALYFLATNSVQYVIECLYDKSTKVLMPRGGSTVALNEFAQYMHSAGTCKLAL